LFVILNFLNSVHYFMFFLAYLNSLKFCFYVSLLNISTPPKFGAKLPILGGVPLHLFLVWLLILLICGLLNFTGKFKFVPLKFVRPPREFRILYGPNVRQTRIDGFFATGEITTDVVTSRVVRKGKIVRQSKMQEFFFHRKM
jgi:hypothetical protein